MNLRRLIPLASSIILLGMGAASARVEAIHSRADLVSSTAYAVPVSPTPGATGVDATGLFLASDSLFAAPVLAPSSGLLFFAGVGVIAGLLEVRRRKFAMEQITR